MAVSKIAAAAQIFGKNDLLQIDNDIKKVAKKYKLL